jgi:hypothetical protein
MAIKKKMDAIKAHMKSLDSDDEKSRYGLTEDEFNHLLQEISVVSQEKDLLKKDSSTKNAVYVALQKKNYDIANILLQSYKESQQKINSDWFCRYSIELYSNSPRYFLDHPYELLDYLNPLLNSQNSEEKERVGKVLLSYVGIYENIYLVKKNEGEPFNEIKQFVHMIYPIAKHLSNAFDDRMYLLSQLINGLIDEKAYFQKVDETVESVKFNNTSPNQKILVIGTPHVNIDDMLDIAAEFGYTEDNFELHTDYDKLKNLDIKRFKNSEKYDAIIVGPIAHSVKGNDYNSFLAKTLSGEKGYPYWTKCITESRELKITAHTFRRALINVGLKIQGSIE